MTIAKAFSAKFLNDMEKFCIWFNQNDYTVIDIVDGQSVTVDADFIVTNLQNFKEPPRNKLHCYIKMLMDNYVIRNSEIEIDDIKGMVNAFTDNKPKKVKKTEISKLSSESEQSETNESVCEEFVSETIVDTTNMKCRLTDVDTSEFYYQCTLSYTTDELVRVFGQPQNNPEMELSDEPSSSFVQIDYRYEWKILLNNTVYSIYDWRTDGTFSTFDCITWNVCTEHSEQKADVITVLKQYINSKLNNVVNDVQIEIHENAIDKDPNDLNTLPVTYDFAKTPVQVDLKNIELDLDDLTFD